MFPGFFVFRGFLNLMIGDDDDDDDDDDDERGLANFLYS